LQGLVNYRKPIAFVQTMEVKIAGKNLRQLNRHAVGYLGFVGGRK